MNGNTQNCIHYAKKRATLSIAVGLALFFLALSLRSVGLFHGLDRGLTFHPDATKQVQAVRNFMDGTFVWYTDSLAYDGYPYGLNHVDAVLLRGLWPLVRGLAVYFLARFEKSYQ